MLLAIAGPIVVARATERCRLRDRDGDFAAATRLRRHASMFAKPCAAAAGGCEVDEWDNLRGVITQLSARSPVKTSADSIAKAATRRSRRWHRHTRAQAEPGRSGREERGSWRTGAPGVTQLHQPQVCAGRGRAEAGPDQALEVQDRLLVANGRPSARCSTAPWWRTSVSALRGAAPISRASAVSRPFKRQDGRWVVVTPKVLFVSQRLVIDFSLLAVCRGPRFLLGGSHAVCTVEVNCGFRVPPMP